ncbi:sigma-70 family RNA polymerase sigma factor [Parvularcula sp. LCG005]|uniref:sigma-70 family RNA polymerase sigma factor n=1 Tax=Parvularcula sp. LCG005 TaxID=3078805 RepID=UPI0029437F0C|nr:sigma-70 family RNA polymerase sigma factor [Parvularcula sp. LCG005]WOI52763.1 sigma-70 family RNA polymerase sigma factor [Parvularcula sp. LCG005]
MTKVDELASVSGGQDAKMQVVQLDTQRSASGMIDLNPCGPLMALAQRGDRRAYDEVLVACQTWLRRYLSTRLVPDQVDDVVQETLLAVHRKRHTYDPSRPFAPWFVAIARFKWLDRLRAIYRAEEDELQDVHGFECHEESVLARIVLERVIQHLPKAQAEALTLAKVEGRSIEEIAIMTGQSASLVKVNIHRARKKLIKYLEKSYE